MPQPDTTAPDTSSAPRAATPGKRAVPRFPGRPLIGSALDLRRDYLGTLLRAQATGADVIRLDAGPLGWRTSLYVAFPPEAVEEVLGRPDRMVRGTRAFTELRQTVGNGLITTEGAEWHRQRRTVAPAFTRRRVVSDYSEAIAREASAAVARWAPAAVRGDPVDAHAEMIGVTARVIGWVLFGTDVGDALPRMTRIGPFTNALLLRRSVTPHPVPRWLPTPGNRRLAAAMAELHDIVKEIIDRRSGETGPASVDRRRANLLDLLLQAEHDDTDPSAPPLSAGEVADQVLVFLLAGHETTATTLACALFELARHPQWQDVLYDEVQTVVGGRRVTADDVPSLVQADHVVREALRLYPSAHTIGRRVGDEGDVVLGYPIPPRSTVVVSPWALHRSPARWPDPGRFDPDRFAVPEPGGSRYAWVPFGAGPHACIGAQLALLEATLVLATVVQAYRLETDLESIPLLAGITLRPATALPVRLRPR